MRNTNTSEQGGQNILRLFITNQANALIRISFAYFTRFIRLDFHHSAVKCMACAGGSVLASCAPKCRKEIHKKTLPRQMHVCETSIDS